MTRIQVARRLGRMLRPLALVMTVSVACRLVNQGLGVAIPAVAAAGVARLASGGSVGGLVALLAAMALLKGLFRYLEQFTGHAVAFRLLSRLRVDTYRRLVPLAPAGLEDERSGDLVARVVGDVARVEPFFAHTIAPFTSAVLVPLLAAVGLAIWVDPVLALVFAPFPLVIALVVPWLRAGRVAQLSARAREQAGETAALLTETVQGAREVAVFRAGDQVEARLGAGSTAVAAIRAALARISSARALIADLLAAGAVVAVAAVASTRLQTGLVDLAGLAAAVAVAWVGTSPARALEEVVPGLDQALAAAERLFTLADRPVPVPEATGGPAPAAASVAFRKVTVRLGGGRHLALDAVDAEIEEGAMVGVVGPSGSGKSTLLELLLRFRDPDSGTVELGGVDLRRLDPTALRRAVALVPQRPQLFYGTIRDNLTLAAPDASDQELSRALARVALDHWVGGLPRGLDTPVGELGETMSGGQRQRIALARTLLRDPKVLILDEATSELDPVSERAVLSTLAEERGRRTLIVVAHRIHTVADADRILVLDRGRLVEQGAHAELLATGGLYAGLWRRHQDVIV